MKKTMILAICAAMLLSFAACGGNGNENGPDGNRDMEKPGDTMTPEEIIAAILDGVEDLPEVDNVAITDRNFESFLFIEHIESAEAVASEALINAVAHSVVVLRLPENGDAAAVAADIESNADPRKWICVEAEKTIVEGHNRTILLVMSDSATADAVAANFNGLWA